MGVAIGPPKVDVAICLKNLRERSLARVGVVIHTPVVPIHVDLFKGNGRPIDSETYRRRIHKKFARVLYRASIDVLHIERELKGGWGARAIKTVLVVLGINVSRRSKINLTLAPFPENGIHTVNEN